MPPGHDLAELREIAVRVAEEAAAQVLRQRAEGVAVAATKTSAVDVVTAADRAAEELISARLSALRPADAILGEEGGELRSGTTGITWLVDPIDGTVNYLYDLPAYAVSVAAAVPDPAGIGGWRSLAGCVVNPRTGETFSAARGLGATMNGLPLRVSEVQQLELALVATGFGYSPERRIEQAKVLPALLGSVRDLRRMGSAALDLCAVGAGRLDGYYESGLHAWDWGAGALVAEEAGAVILGAREGEPAGRGFILAASPAIAMPLRELVQPAS